MRVLLGVSRDRWASRSEQGARAGLVARARTLLVDATRVASQCLLLLAIYLVGSSLVQALHLAVPGNLLGLLILLLLLQVGLVRPSQIEEVGTFVTRHLTFLFVPLAVGIMTQGSLFATSGAALVVSLVGAAAVGVATAGLVAQAVGRRAGAPHAGT